MGGDVGGCVQRVYPLLVLCCFEYMKRKYGEKAFTKNF